jgi:hypothetical protein
VATEKVVGKIKIKMIGHGKRENSKKRYTSYIIVVKCKKFEKNSTKKNILRVISTSLGPNDHDDVVVMGPGKSCGKNKIKTLGHGKRENSKKNKHTSSYIYILGPQQR